MMVTQNLRLRVGKETGSGTPRVFLSVPLLRCLEILTLRVVGPQYSWTRVRCGTPCGRLAGWPGSFTIVPWRTSVGPFT